MNLLELMEKHKTEDEVIIKRKKEILDFTIKNCLVGFSKRDLNIYIDSEKLCVDKTTIKIENLKKIYITKVKRTHLLDDNTYWLEFKGKSMRNSKGINITSSGININITILSEEELDKIDQIFNYFVFSNEKDYKKLVSNDYEFLCKDNLNEYKYNFNIYNENQETANCLIINNKEYFFIQVMPKCYYKKYLKNNYMLFESRCQNPNYMDVWIEKNTLRFEMKRRILLFKILIFAILIIYIYSKIRIILSR